MTVVLSFAKIKKVSVITKIMVKKVTGLTDSKKRRYHSPLQQLVFLLDLFITFQFFPMFKELESFGKNWKAFIVLTEFLNRMVTL